MAFCKACLIWDENVKSIEGKGDRRAGTKLSWGADAYLGSTLPGERLCYGLNYVIFREQLLPILWGPLWSAAFSELWDFLMRLASILC